jgi:hypothetical protein
MPTYLFFIDGLFESQHATLAEAKDALCHYGKHWSLRIIALDMAEPGKSEDVTAELVMAEIRAGGLQWDSDLAREHTPRSVSLDWLGRRHARVMYGERG